LSDIEALSHTHTHTHTLTQKKSSLCLTSSSPVLRDMLTSFSDVLLLLCYSTYFFFKFTCRMFPILNGTTLKSNDNM